MATKESTESNFVTWAREELDRAGLFDESSDYGGMLGEEVMRLVESFAEAGHSGFSAQMAASIFTQLAAWKPLGPLTDDPGEWMHIAEEMAGQADLWQSRRNPACFSNDGGKTFYDIDEKPARWRRIYQRVTRKPCLKYHVSAGGTNHDH